MSSTYECPRTTCVCASRGVSRAACPALTPETSHSLLSREFKNFHDQHRVNFLKYARSRGLSFEDAEDIIHEAFLILYRKWPEVLGSTNRQAYAFTVVKGAIADHCRREDRQPTTTASLDSASTRASAAPQTESNEVNRLITMLDIERALAALPERQAECMRLYALLDLTTAEIARYLDIDRSTVTSNLHAARRRLTAANAQRGRTK